MVVNLDSSDAIAIGHTRERLCIGRGEFPFGVAIVIGTLLCALIVRVHDVRLVLHIILLGRRVVHVDEL